MIICSLSENKQQQNSFEKKICLLQMSLIKIIH